MCVLRTVVKTLFDDYVAQGALGLNVGLARPNLAKVAENGEQDRLEMFGAIKLYARIPANKCEHGPRQPTEGRIRKNRIWLPERNTDPNTRMENFGGVTFSLC
jgi:hypothetical protein